MRVSVAVRVNDCCYSKLMAFELSSSLFLLSSSAIPRPSLIQLHFKPVKLWVSPMHSSLTSFACCKQDYLMQQFGAFADAGLRQYSLLWLKLRMDYCSCHVWCYNF